MKLTLLLLFLSIFQIFSKNCTEIEHAEESEDCKKLDVNNEGERCCYFYSKTSSYGIIDEFKYCDIINKTEYDNIEETIEAKKKEFEDRDNIVHEYEIDCKENYLKFMGLILILNFLLMI